MTRAGIDFQTEAVVLARYTLGSGTFKVSMLTPEDDGNEVLIRIVRDQPQSATTDMAYHCFAVVVPKSRWERVRIKTIDGPDEILKIIP